MTRVAYFDPFSGASGDMILGALVACGLEAEALERAMAELPIGRVRIEAETVMRGPISATRLKVTAPPEPAPSRAFREIAAMVEEAPFSPAVRRRALGAFRRMAEAEGRIHGMAPEDVHFHEVGAVDSIVDIAGSAWAVEALAIDAIYCAPPALGTGTVASRHGELPLPAPATLEILRGVPVRHRDSGRELTTPTGAAILSSFSAGFGPAPDIVLDRVGYGAGDDAPGHPPNVLRLWLGTAPAAGPGAVSLLETNVDDCPGEWLGHLAESLFEAGALDVYFTPIYMKKGRPAYQVSVLSPSALVPELEALLFAESTTFGVRRLAASRSVLDRETKVVRTPWGPIRVKIGRRAGAVVSVAPEFGDVREAARRSGVPVREIHRRAVEIFHQEGGAETQGSS